MERTISQEERIRRAEELYNKRRQDRNDRMYYYTKQDRTSNGIKARITKKVVAQLIVSLAIYLGIYMIQNSNYVFSAGVANKIQGFLSYDLEFNKLYEDAITYLKNNFSFLGGVLEQKDSQENNIENTIEDTSNSEIVENIENIENIEAIGGEVEEPIPEVQKSQTELDIEYIKDNYNIIWPLAGRITSPFGTREATEIVTANHYGIDIGGNTGDAIVAAMDGIVTLTSEEGGYGKHIQIKNGEVYTLYAHCSKLLVSEGTEVKQGQKIAEVGSTGRATGPHLHFEIKREDRVLDPQTILGEL